MALARRRARATIATLACFLLIAVLACLSAATRLPLESKNDSEDSFTTRSNEDMRLATLAEDSLRDHDAGLSLRRADEDMDGPLLAIPQFMDRILSSAFSSVDRASSGLLSGLAGPNMDFARSKDGERLIVRLHLPPVDTKHRADPVSPRLSVALLGRSHLRVKLDMRSEGFQSLSEHTYGLPVHVSSDDMIVTPQEDGTVHVSLRIVNDADVSNDSAVEKDLVAENDTVDSLLTRRLRNPLFHMLIRRDAPADSGSEEVVEELPRPEDIAHCRSRHPNEKIARKKCMCDVTPSKSGKAVCYGSLISKAVSVARRLGMQDFATNAKHHAIECADGQVNAVECLEKVSSQLLQSLYSEDSSKPGGRLEDRVRAAIESEDDGPSNFEPSFATILIFLTIVVLVVLFAGCAMLYGIKKFGGNVQSNRILSELSSVLTQTRKPSTTSDAFARQGLRAEGFHGTVKHSSSRVTRKPGTKSTAGESKIA